MSSARALHVRCARRANDFIRDFVEGLEFESNRGLGHLDQDDRGKDRQSAILGLNLI